MENAPYEGGPKPLSGSGVIHEVFHPPLLSTPPIWGQKGYHKETDVTKILPNVRVIFLARFGSKPLFCWVMTGKPLGLFRKFFGAVRAIFWHCGSFLSPDPWRPLIRGPTAASIQSRYAVALHSVALRFPACGGESQENRAASLKGLKGPCKRYLWGVCASNHKSQIASDLKSRSPNRKNFPQNRCLGQLKSHFQITRFAI